MCCTVETYPKGTVRPSCSVFACPRCFVLSVPANRSDHSAGSPGHRARPNPGPSADESIPVPRPCSEHKLPRVNSAGPRARSLADRQGLTRRTAATEEARFNADAKAGKRSITLRSWERSGLLKTTEVEQIRCRVVHVPLSNKTSLHICNWQIDGLTNI